MRESDGSSGPPDILVYCIAVGIKSFEKRIDSVDIYSLRCIRISRHCVLSSVFSCLCFDARVNSGKI